ncbi:MAG: NTP transferase domain-containing protein [Armatimonadetes bacterium]|nr:NTP transferase domain-containing protein [Armatimonadota bacterium]
MTSRTRIAIVAAAGRGTRFGAAGTKVLADIAGRPCVQRVLDCVEAALGEHHQLLVVGHEAERVVAKVGAAVHRRFVHQPEQRGTGHALAVALAQVDADDADVYPPAARAAWCATPSIRSPSWNTRQSPRLTAGCRCRAAAGRATTCWPCAR